MESLLGEVGRRLAQLVRPGAQLLLQRHLAAGHFVIVLSASPQPLVQAVAGRLRAHRAVGSFPGEDCGRYTGDLVGPFCYGEGKLERLENDVGPGVIDAATAYADSISDLPVLACREPVAINPDRRLGQLARTRRWPILRIG